MANGYLVNIPELVMCVYGMKSLGISGHPKGWPYKKSAERNAKMQMNYAGKAADS